MKSLYIGWSYAIALAIVTWELSLTVESLHEHVTCRYLLHRCPCGPDGAVLEVLMRGCLSNDESGECLPCPDACSIYNHCKTCGKYGCLSCYDERKGTYCDILPRNKSRSVIEVSEELPVTSLAPNEFSGQYQTDEFEILPEEELQGMQDLKSNVPKKEGFNRLDNNARLLNQKNGRKRNLKFISHTLSPLTDFDEHSEDLKAEGRKSQTFHERSFPEPRAKNVVEDVSYLDTYENIGDEDSREDLYSHDFPSAEYNANLEPSSEELKYRDSIEYLPEEPFLKRAKNRNHKKRFSKKSNGRNEFEKAATGSDESVANDDVVTENEKITPSKQKSPTAGDEKLRDILSLIQRDIWKNATTVSKLLQHPKLEAVDSFPLVFTRFFVIKFNSSNESNGYNSSNVTDDLQRFIPLHIEKIPYSLFEDPAREKLKSDLFRFRESLSNFSKNTCDLIPFLRFCLVDPSNSTQPEPDLFSGKNDTTDESIIEERSTKNP